MAVRFTLPGGGVTDVEGQAHNGFAVGTGEDFLALLKAAHATDPRHRFEYCESIISRIGNPKRCG